MPLVDHGVEFLRREPVATLTDRQLEAASTQNWT